MKQLTIPAYAGFPSTTITVTAGTPAYCRGDAQAFARDAVRFFRPFPSDADEYRLQARVQFIDFKAHLCEVAILPKELSRRLTLKRRRVIVRRFRWLGKTGPELTKEP